MLSFLPLDVLDEIWDVTESVSEEFLTYSCNAEIHVRPKDGGAMTNSLNLYPIAPSRGTHTPRL